VTTTSASAFGSTTPSRLGEAWDSGAQADGGTPPELRQRPGDAAAARGLRPRTERQGPGAVPPPLKSLLHLRDRVGRRQVRWRLR
jgi:hypothetical protein